MVETMAKNPSTQTSDSVSVVLCGQAGQGIQTVEFLLTRMLKLAGYNVFATKEYMSRVRGGTNSTEIRVSSGPVRAPVNRIDLLFALDKGALSHLADRISPQTTILAEKEVADADPKQAQRSYAQVGFVQLAGEIGSKVYSNVVAVGTLAALFAVELEAAAGFVERFFSKKAEQIVRNNIKAVGSGYKVGTDLVNSGRIQLDIGTDAALKDQILLNGAEAVGLGAIAGGCNFICAYPMSPSTNVLVFLAQHGEQFGMIAEQAEDEIAAINMAVGAWYAGARAMVSTSGGGFALMTEGLSLAGMLESPVVIHLAQRPGPATGLPTRTEQGDLELALYAGHGEFPRIILAPGRIEDAFYLTQKAFNLADKYQVPVFILTDQYFMDSYYNMGSLDLAKINIETHIVETEEDYKRYEMTETGISPRGVPGFGKGLVAVDSDEHDAEGHITEDLDLRVKMVDKRLRKLEQLKNEIVPPELLGPDDYETLVVCWGSTFNIVNEAVQNLDRDDVAFLYFKQVYPLHEQTAYYLSKAERTVIIEGNATSQFGKLVKLYTGIEFDHKILKYSGLNFAVEEIAQRLRAILS
jgi:2-oxoglutarate ferredoxin oxidoreductase subunit alpha